MKKSVKITVKDVTIGEYTKIVNSIKNPKKTNAIYDCDNHSVSIQTIVETIFEKLHLGAFKRGFERKLNKVLGVNKEIVVEEM